VRSIFYEVILTLTIFSNFVRPPLICLMASLSIALLTTQVQAQAPAVLTLNTLIEQAKASHLLLEVARQEVAISEAGLTTAKAYPNPEIEIIPGYAQFKSSTGHNRSSALGVAQPIELPGLRQSRIALATSYASSAVAAQRVTLAQITDLVRVRAIDVVRTQEELVAVAEDLQLTKQILNSVQVRVRSGEAPRFDLIRAEAEVGVAEKNQNTAQIRLKQTKANLQLAVGSALPDAYSVQIDNELNNPLQENDYQLTRLTVKETNPEILAAQKDTESATRLLDFEQRSVLPQLVLKLQHERDAEVSFNRIGVNMVVPLFNRREGPIAQAGAAKARAIASLEARQYTLANEFDAAWQSYQLAQQQVNALDKGILQRAKSVLGVAEAAYRLGERGILEFLDAQRQFRLVRNELITARYSLFIARTQLERLAGR
jgi:outer membrane protein, heavy metal efflux system